MYEEIIFLKIFSGEQRGKLQGWLPRVSDRDNALPRGEGDYQKLINDQLLMMNHYEGGTVRRELILCPPDDSSPKTL